MISSVVETVTWMVVGAVGVLAFLWWWGRRAKPSKGSLVLRLRRELRRLTNDDSVVSRLVAKERERHPELSEAALLKRVVRRIARDKKR